MHVYERDNVKYTSPIDEFSTDDIPEESLGKKEDNLFLKVRISIIINVICVKKGKERIS